ncbi:MAG: hypothetical protein KAT79_02920 [candidate division Zixibacteria bacterium]|nr:hypothetical protein [candidate division Zixibacteria bacterium]
MALQIHPVTEQDKTWLMKIVRTWGADFVITRGRKVYPTEIEGFYAAEYPENRPTWYPPAR